MFNIIAPGRVTDKFTDYTLLWHNFRSAGQIKDKQTGTWFAVFNETSRLDAGTHETLLLNDQALTQAVGLCSGPDASARLVPEPSSSGSLISGGAVTLKRVMLKDELPGKLETFRQAAEDLTRTIEQDAPVLPYEKAEVYEMSRAQGRIEFPSSEELNPPLPA